MRRFLLKTSMAVVALATSAHYAVAGDVTGELVKWHPVTVSFDGPASNEGATNPNPFMDYRLQVEFTAPSGEVFNVPGFFDGDGNGNGNGNVWRVRFSPSEPGSWSYSASLRQGANVAVNLNPNAGSPQNLAGSNGTFFIADRDPNAPGFLKWGRLQYVDKHYLKFADGNYWIKGGVDSPENFLGYKGFDNTNNQSGGVGTNGLENGVHRYLPHVDDFEPGDPNFTSEDNGFDGRGIIGAMNYLSSENVNSIYFLPMNLGGDGRETYPFVDAGNNNFNKTHYDISKLAQWNIALNHAQRKGLALHFVLAETESGNENWFDNGSLGNERRLYYRELIARFGYLLAIKWNLSEENDFSVAELRAFADYISALDWAEHQITFHIKPNRIDEYSPHLGDARFDTTSIQYRPDNANDFVETMRSRTASNGRPLVIDLDENSPASTGLTTSNAADLRRRVLYDTYFSGGNIEWYFGYHSLPLGGDMRTENFRTREPMYRYMWYARKFMQENLEFWDMQPADNLLSGENNALGGGQVFAAAGDTYAIYLPEASPSGSINLPAGSYTKRWYNPRSGAFQGASEDINGGNVGLGTPPSNAGDDWVVLIKTADSGGNRPPAVTFSTPANGAQFDAGANISVTATASDSDGSVESVQLFLNGSLVRRDSAAPYAWGGNGQDLALQNLDEGSYTLRLIATDNGGATAESTISINVGQGQCVPADQNGYLSFEAESMTPLGDWVLKSDSAASGNQYIVWESAQHFNNQDNGRLAIDFQINDPGTYRIQWHTKSFIAPGSEHNDTWMKISGGNADFYAERGTARYYPNGSGKTPNPNGTSGSGFFKIYTNQNDWAWQSTTSDNEGFPVFVDFPVAGTYTFEVAARSSSHGLDRVVMHKSSVSNADAQDLSRPLSCGDDSGGGNNQAPTVSFSEPANGQEFVAGSDISVSAVASDSDGSVANVELSLNGTLIRQDRAAPYQWGDSGQDPALQNLSAGTYQLRAVATDDGGATTAATITITVTQGGGGNVPPTVSFASPSDGQRFDVGSDVSVVAVASDSDGTVANVRLNLNDTFVRQENVSAYEWGERGQDPALQNLAAGRYVLKVVATDNGGAVREETITIIVGSTASPEVGLTSVNISEDVGTAIVKATLSGAATGDVSIGVHTIPKTAINGQDFHGLSRQFTIPAGSLNVDIPVVILDDTAVEEEEFFNVRIYEASGASIGNQIAAVTINDNDGGNSVPMLSIGDLSVTEGELATLRVVMSEASISPVKVEIATSRGEAINGEDFYGTFQILTIEPGETEVSLSVPTLDDSAAESDEAFNYRIFNADGATVANPVASVVIRDND